jgi:hypothetical protein
MAVFEGVPQSFQAEQRKRGTVEQERPSCHQEEIGIVIKLRKMPEENHGE